MKRFFVPMATLAIAVSTLVLAPPRAANATACLAGPWIADPKITSMPPVRYETTHFTVRWKGDDVSMADAKAAGETLEMVWTVFMDTVRFPQPYCASRTKYKANVHVDPTFGLTGGLTAEGDMGMWIGPGGLLDHWGLAHEFAHGLQTITGSFGGSPYASFFFESHANWMAHQLPEYRTTMHCSEFLVNEPHLYYGSSRDRYCNWQFLEYLKDRFGYAAVDDLWGKAPKPGSDGYGSADPFSVLAANRRWTVSQLNDAFSDWAMHNVAWDYVDPDGTDRSAAYFAAYGTYASRDGDRRHRVTELDTVDLSRHRYAVPFAWAPQRWGYNLVHLVADPAASSVAVTFRGMVQTASATARLPGLGTEPATIPEPDSDWRWGLVAIDQAGKPRYSALRRGASGTLRFPRQTGDKDLYMVVVGTPSKRHKILDEQMYYSIYRYPWAVQIIGATPDANKPEAASAPVAGRRHANGGGFVASAASVAATAYVGPSARVLGGHVLDKARILDHATVMSGTVSGNATVEGIGVVTGNAVVKDNALVDTAFKGVGAFGQGVVLSGEAKAYGDLELWTASVPKGVYSGFVDDGVVAGSAQTSRTGLVPEVTRRPTASDLSNW